MSGKEDEENGLRPGSHIQAVARLQPGGTHTIARRLGSAEPRDVMAARNKLTHLATSISGRVRQRLPENQYTTSTGVLVADSKLYVAVIVERVW